MPTPHYTIIIPHYNNPDSLSRLLNSIPQRDDVQVIVVDDCSTKDLEKFDKLKSIFPNIEWLSTQSNGGAGKARNVGLAHARGKYLIFADADDYFNECFNDVLNEFKTDNTSLTYFLSDVIEEETGRILSHRASANHILRSIKLPRDLNKLKYTITYPWAKIILRDMIVQNNIRFQETTIGNDVWFSTQCDHFSEDSVNICLKSFYTYSKNKESISHNPSPTKLVDSLLVASKKLHFLKKHKIPVSAYRLLGNSIKKILKFGDESLQKEALKIARSCGISKLEFYCFGYISLIKNSLRSLVRKIYLHLVSESR